MEVMVYVIFALLIYLIVAMPSKKYLRRLVGAEGDRAPNLAALLRSRLGQGCTLVFDDVVAGVGSTRLAGTLIDVDDEWACVECVDEKTGAAQLKAVRLGLIRSLEE